MTTTVDSAVIDMPTFYDRIKDLGISKKFFRSYVLPNWWSPEYEKSSESVVMAALYASRLFNVDLQSLLDLSCEPRFAGSPSSKFKTATNTIADRLTVAHQMALQTMTLVMTACPVSYQDLTGWTAKKIREIILAKHDVVTLDGILEFCWQSGIPVIFLKNFPKSTHKFHGMATLIQGRPAITIALNARSPARLAFVVGHELGHIIYGHVANGTVIDEKVELKHSDNLEELAANDFSAELLIGNPQRKYNGRYRYRAPALVDFSKKQGALDRVDPAIIAWNYGWYEEEPKPWAAVQAALKILENSISAPEIIARHVKNSIDFDSLSKDNQEYLSKILDLA